MIVIKRSGFEGEKASDRKSQRKFFPCISRCNFEFIYIFVFHTINKQSKVVFHSLGALHYDAFCCHIDEEVSKWLSDFFIWVPFEVLLCLELGSEHFAGILRQNTHFNKLTEWIRRIAKEVIFGGITNLQIFNEHKFLISSNQFFRSRLLVPNS